MDTPGYTLDERGHPDSAMNATSAILSTPPSPLHDLLSFLPLEPASFTLPPCPSSTSSPDNSPDSPPASATNTYGYTLHKNSINPAFDLVALYLDPPLFSSSSSHNHGKNENDKEQKKKEPPASTVVRRPIYVPGKGWIIPGKKDEDEDKENKDCGRGGVPVPDERRRRRQRHGVRSQTLDGENRREEEGREKDGSGVVDDEDEDEDTLNSWLGTLEQSASHNLIRSHHTHLFAPSSSSPSPSASALTFGTNASNEKEKEKNKKEEGNTIHVGLWRVSGKNVWRTRIWGKRVRGMVWDVRGLYLSLLVESEIPPSEDSKKPGSGSGTGSESKMTSEKGNGKSKTDLRIVHLSVHDGSVVRTVFLQPHPDLDVNLNESKTSSDMDMIWLGSQDATSTAKGLADTETETDSTEKSGWPSPSPGSAASILDSLARPDAVKAYSSPPQGNNNNGHGGSGLPFGVPATSSTKALPGSKTTANLAFFPALLPDQTKPDILHIPGLGLNLLSGCLAIPTPPQAQPSTSSLPSFSSPGLSYPISGGDGFNPSSPVPSSQILKFAQSTETIRTLLDEIWKGLDVVEIAWKEGMKKENENRLQDLEGCATDNGADLQATLTDLARLLLTGRSGDAVTQFIGTKLTERNLTKWEKTYTSTVDLIHRLISQSIFPSLERVILLMEEMLGWSMYPQHFSQLQLRPSTLTYALSWLKHLGHTLMHLSREIQDDGKKFEETIKWLKTENSRANLNDPEEETPLPAIHDPILVCSYLESGFEESRLDEYFLGTEERKKGGYKPPRLPKRPASRTLANVLGEALANVHSKWSISPFVAGPTGNAPSAATMGEQDQDQEETDLGNQSLYAITYSVTQLLQGILSRALLYSDDGRRPKNDSNVGVNHKQLITDEMRLYAARSSDPCTIIFVRISLSGLRSYALHFAQLTEKNKDRILDFQFYDETSLVMLVEVEDAEMKEEEDGKRRFLASLSIAEPDLPSQKPRDESVSSALQADTNIHEKVDVSFSKLRFIDHYRPEHHHLGASYLSQLSTNGRKGRGIAAILTNHGNEVAVFDMTVDEGEDEDGVVDEDEDVDEDEVME